MFFLQFWLEQFEKSPKFDALLALKFVEAGLQRQFDMACDGGSQTKDLSGIDMAVSEPGLPGSQAAFQMA